ncbi:MAG: hypothetical protein R2867_01545 [Caldilineaceae bacterium]
MKQLRLNQVNFGSTKGCFGSGAVGVTLAPPGLFLDLPWVSLQSTPLRIAYQPKDENSIISL